MNYITEKRDVTKSPIQLVRSDDKASVITYHLPEPRGANRHKWAEGRGCKNTAQQQ